MIRFRRLQFLALAACLLAGQQLAASPQNQSPKSAKSHEAAHTKKKHHGILDLVPVFDVTNTRSGAPLSPSEKLRLALDNSANPFTVAEAALKAEFYRGVSPTKKIGHGGAGYLRQWGASYLDEISGSLFHTFLYPTILHQDPRYHRKGEGSIASRVAYSFSRVFVTRSDHGRKELNASMILGSMTSTALSNAYYPPTARSAEVTARNVGLSLLGDVVGNVFKEFWPDAARRLRRRR